MTELQVMNWHLRSITANLNPADPEEQATQPQPIAPPISREEFEDMMARGYGIAKSYNDHELEDDASKPSRRLMTWKEWHQHYGDDHVSMMLDNERAIHDRFLSHWPEDYTLDHALRDYREGRLPSRDKSRYQHQNLPIESADVGARNLPWQPQNRQPLSQQQAMAIWQAASVKLTKSNEKQVMDARKGLFFAFNSDPQLSQKIGIKPSELNRKIKSYGGLTAAGHKLEMNLNNQVPEEHTWNGISNSTFLGKMAVDPEDLEQFVKSISVDGPVKHYYMSDSGKTLRRYIASTFLGIDTRISYKDLSFRVGEINPEPYKRPPRGVYMSRTKSINIADLNPNTVAHEVGHYLDDKWGDEYSYAGGNASYLSELVGGRKDLPPAHAEWVRRHAAFIRNLCDKGNISSAYYQEPKETFARFIDFFTMWTAKQAGSTMFHQHHTYADGFTPQDAATFVRLLQEKSYIDAKFPLPARAPIV